jgi:hypothetical protein
LTAAVLPGWLQLAPADDTAWLLSGIPLAEDVGEHLVELVATDAAGVTITQTFVISVALDPEPFQLGALNFTIDEDEPLQATLSVTHVEAAVLTFSVLQDPGQGTLSEFDELVGTFTYVPAPDAVGDDFFTAAASDELGRTVTLPVTVTVAAVNDPPQIFLEETYTVAVDSRVAVAVVVTDVETDEVAVEVAALPTGLVYDTERGLITGTVAAIEAGPYVALVTATDSQEATAERTVTWVVEASLPPELLPEVPVEDTPDPAASPVADGNEMPASEETAEPKEN